MTVQQIIASTASCGHRQDEVVDEILDDLLFPTSGAKMAEVQR